MAFLWNTGFGLGEYFGYIIIGALLALAGGAAPDWDFDLGIQYHRNSITHSAILPTIFYMTFFFGLSPDPNLLAVGPVSMFISAMFLLGYASHLFLDLFPQRSDLLKIVDDMIKEKAPGDIRDIPEKYERFWLFLGGSLNMAFAALLLARGSSIVGLDFPALDSGVTLISLSLSVLFVILLIAYLGFWFRLWTMRKE